MDTRRPARNRKGSVMYHLTLKSGNQKTGPIPVSTTSAVTCPPACPFNNANEGGCYAESGPLALHWRKVTSGERGTDFANFLAAISALPGGQLWRHNQAGDLPGTGSAINATEMRALVAANKGRRGFTYTHKPLTAKNRALIRHANDNGFTVNLSGNNLAHADTLADANIGPVVSVVPEDTPEVTKTPAGRKVIICPAQTRDKVSCATCQLCARKDRRGIIIGFRAHGTGKRKAEITARA